MLCPGCGNEIDAGDDCRVCAHQRARRKRDIERVETSLCPSCGNTIYGIGPCDVCNADRAPRKRAPGARTQLCTGCGNEMPAGEPCPICESGRSGRRRRRHGEEGVVHCLNCEEALEAQDWDGTTVHMCASCQGMLFPPGALERVLDRLRDSASHIEFAEVVREFRDRHRQQRVAKSVRYRHCPACDQLMVRRNYRGTSGVILDQCGDHGHWVDQQAFGELSDWISRGGDQLAARHDRRR